MRATGVVRRIDDLGRIVIPKEIRRNLRIRDGESMEIFVDDSSIVLKKFSIMGNVDEYAFLICSTLYSISHKGVVITDCDSVIACSSNVKGVLNKSISDSLVGFIKQRGCLEGNGLAIINDYSVDAYYVSVIVSNGDVVGLVLIFGDDITDDDRILCSFASKILSKSIEE